jgi:hypothetical protein
MLSVSGSPRILVWNPVQNRTYVTDYGGMSVFVIRDSLTAIEEDVTLRPLVMQSHVLVYPSPACDWFVVCPPHADADCGLRIYDVSGNMVKAVSLPKGRLQVRVSLEGIGKGIYFVAVGDAAPARKVVVAR